MTRYHSLIAGVGGSLRHSWPSSVRALGPGGPFFRVSPAPWIMQRTEFRDPPKAPLGWRFRQQEARVEEIMPDRDFRRIQDAINAIRTEEDLDRAVRIIRELAARYGEQAGCYAESAGMVAGARGIGPAAP